MKKFSLTFPGSAPRVVNANEYSVYPKAAPFAIPFGDSTLPAYTTSGKGKSVENNFYLYWVEIIEGKKTLFWTKISAAEFAVAREARLDSVGEAPKAAPAPEPEPEFDPGEPVGDDPEKLAARAAFANSKRKERRRATA